MIKDMERKGIVILCLVLFIIYYCKLFLLNDDPIYYHESFHVFF